MIVRLYMGYRKNIIQMAVRFGFVLILYIFLKVLHKENYYYYYYHHTVEQVIWH